MVWNIDLTVGGLSSELSPNRTFFVDIIIFIPLQLILVFEWTWAPPYWFIEWFLFGFDKKYNLYFILDFFFFFLDGICLECRGRSSFSLPRTSLFIPHRRHWTTRTSAWSFFSGSLIKQRQKVIKPKKKKKGCFFFARILVSLVLKFVIRLKIDFTILRCILNENLSYIICLSSK